jgi:hypothetical protein
VVDSAFWFLPLVCNDNDMLFLKKFIYALCEFYILSYSVDLIIRDRSLFMAGGGTEEKCFSWQKFC